MAKYLRILREINSLNKKIVLRIDKCNGCPLMKYHAQNNVATCRKFKDEDSNIINDCVLSFETVGGNTSEGLVFDNRIIEPIEIPEWCGLINTVEDLEKSDVTYIVNDTRILLSNSRIEKNLPIYDASTFKEGKTPKPKKYKDIDDTLELDENTIKAYAKSLNKNTKPVCNDSSCGFYGEYAPFCDQCADRIVDYKKIEDIVSKLPKEKLELYKKTRKQNSKINCSECGLYNDYTDLCIDCADGIFSTTKIKEEEEDDDEEYEGTNVSSFSITKGLVCSSCGKYDMDVDRLENNGMCPTCFETYKDNNDKMKQIVINNFRLKRGAIFNDKTFKLI